MEFCPPIELKIEKIVKETPNQIKKHISQFTETEFHVLNAFVNEICGSKVLLTSHSKTKIPFLNQEIVDETLADCDVIEFNVTNSRPRLLVRSNKQLAVIVEGEHTQANVCIVIDMWNLAVVTSYLNKCDDFHKQLVQSRYDENLDVIKYATI